MNLEDLRKKGEEFLAPTNVKVNQKAVKKALLAGGFLFTNLGLGAVNYKLYTSANSNPAVVTEDKTNDNEENQINNETAYDVSVGYEFAVSDAKEEVSRTSNLGIELLNNGFYSLSETDESINDLSIDQVTLNVTAFYEVINNAEFDKVTVSERNFKRDANSLMDDFQDLAIRMGMQGQYGATIPDLHNLVGHKQTRNFVQEFTTKINSYLKDKSNTENRKSYQKFIESIQIDPKYNDVEEEAKYLCVIIGNLATPEVFSEYFQDLYLENIANCVVEKDSKYNFKQKELLDAKNLLSVWYSDTMASLEDTFDVDMVSSVAPGELNAYGHKVVTEDQLQREVRDNISKGYDLNTGLSNLNRLEQEKNNTPYHKVLRSGGKNLNMPSVIKESATTKQKRIQEIKNQEKNVVENGDEGRVINKDNVVTDIKKDDDGKKAQDLTFQQGVEAAIAIRKKYSKINADCIKELENHKKSDAYQNNKLYRDGFDQQMKRYVNEYNKANEKWENPLPDEKPNGDEKKEVVDQKTEYGPETNIEYKKDETKKDETQKTDNTDNKKEEESKPTDTTNNNNNQNTEKNDYDKVPDTYIPIGGETEEKSEDNGKGEIVNKKEEDSDETIIEYKPEEHASSLTKTVSKSSTSTRSKRLEQYKALKSDTEQVKTVIDQTQNQNETGKTK